MPPARIGAFTKRLTYPVTLRDKIPPIYHAFFPELLELEIPPEKIATCDNCTLCLSSKSPYFHTKCCTYYPHLPNYLVGGILQENDASMAEGGKRLRRLISQKKGVSPYGIIPPVEYTNRRTTIRKKNFGEIKQEENQSILCPYYDHGRCTVWKYRENLCVTYFCAPIANTQGRVFWDKVNEYLKRAEMELAQYALLELGWPPQAILTSPIKGDTLGLDDANGAIDEEKYAELWQDWAGREEEWYGQCYEIIASLGRATFERITGVSREILEQSIINTQQSLAQAAFPDYLQFNPDTRIEPQEGKMLLLSTAEGHTEISAIALPLIKAFDGQRTTTEVFHLGYKIMMSLEQQVEKLIAIRALQPVE
jgi:hypothetical protein